MAKGLIDTKVLLFLIIGFLLFTAPNFSFQMSTFYSIMVIAIAIGIIWDKDRNKNLPFEKDNKRLSGILIAGLILLLFLGISTLVTGTIAGSSQSIADVVQVWSQSQAPLVESKYLNIFIFSVLVPIIESLFFFGIAFEFFAHYLKIPLKLDLSNPRQLSLITIISVAFTATHFAVRGVTNLPGLAITALFAIVSMIMVLKQGYTRDAIIFHAMNNLLVFVLVGL